MDRSPEMAGKWFKSVGLLVALLIASARMSAEPPAAGEEERARLLAVAGEEFRVLATDHFIIAYDTPYEALRPLTGRLEGTYDAVRRFCEGSGLACNPPTARMQVVLFDRHDAFTDYLAGIGLRGGSIAGVYHQPTEIAAFCNMADSPGFREIAGQIEQTQRQLDRLGERRSGSRSNRQQKSDLKRYLSTLRVQRDVLARRFNRFVVQHEAAHQMLFSFGIHARGADNPFWLTEGLACQFEVAQSDSGKPLTRINHVRLGDFRDALGVSPNIKTLSEDAYRKAVGDARFAPLTELIADPELLRGPAHVAFHYAQTWALVYYLNREHPDAFALYLRQVGTRSPGEAVGREREIGEFQAAFGAPDEAFQRSWVDFMLKLRFDRREAGR